MCLCHLKRYKQWGDGEARSVHDLSVEMNSKGERVQLLCSFSSWPLRRYSMCGMGMSQSGPVQFFACIMVSQDVSFVMQLMLTWRP